jgi:hypothetical protein
VLWACGPTGGPPRSSAHIEVAATPLPSDLAATDSFHGRAYAMTLDGLVFEIGEPTRMVIDASDVVTSAWWVSLRMRSADSAWVLVGGEQQRLELIGTARETIRPGEGGLPAGRLSNFDLAPDGTLWVLVDLDAGTGSLCSRPGSGAFVCVAVVGGDRIVAIDGAVLVVDDYPAAGASPLAIVSGGAATRLEVPGGRVGDARRLDRDRALIEATTEYGDSLGVYAIDASGAATLLFESRDVSTERGPIDVFARASDDELYVTFEYDWDDDCNPLSISTCHDGHYNWHRYVVWQWDGTSIAEVGQVALGRLDVRDDAIGGRARIIPVDATTFLLGAADTTWTGAR